MPASCPRYPLPHHPAPCPARDQDSHITLWRGPNNRHQGQGSELLLQALPVSPSCTSGMPKSCVRSIVTKQIQPSLYVRTAGRTLGLNSGSELGTSHSSCSCSTARAHLKVVDEFDEFASTLLQHEPHLVVKNDWEDAKEGQRG